MELDARYKPSEVGPLPEGWEVKSVRELVELRVLEKPLDGNHGEIHPKSSDYVGHGIPFIMASNVSGGRVDLEGCKHIRKNLADTLRKGFARTGDVLLTHKGTVGQTALLGPLPYPYLMLTPQVTYYRVTVPARLSSEFLRQYFDSERFQALFTSLSGGGTRAYLGIEKQLDLPILFPPVAEQTAMAAVLSDVDALLGALDRLIAKKRDLKQAAMQQLLTGQTRLPGFSGKWDSKPLASVLSMGRLGGNYPNQDTETEYPLIKMGNIGRGNIDVSVIEYVAHGITPDQEHRLRGGDVLFNTRNTLDLVGKVGIWRDELPVAYFNSNLMRLEFKPDQVCNEFANYALNTCSAVAQLRALATGTTSVAAIYTRDLMNMAFATPPLAEQRAIAHMLSDMDMELRILEQRRDKTRLLKQGMMQELLTGRTRLV